MFELIVGENFIKRFVPRGDRVRQTAATSANPNTSTDQTALRVLGRDYVAAGPLRLAKPPLAAQIGWLLPLALIGGFAAWRRYRGSLGQPHIILSRFRCYDCGVCGEATYIRKAMTRYRRRLISRSGFTLLYGVTCMGLKKTPSL
jgi:hypothetical protein